MEIKEIFEINKKALKNIQFNKYILPNKKTIVLTDIHFPFVDFKNIEAIIKFIKENNIEMVVLLGDIIDFFEISSYSKNIKLSDTVEGFGFLKYFIQILKNNNIEIHYRLGNHEERFEKFINMKAKEIAELISFTKLLDTEKIKYYTKFDILLTSSGYFLWHGHELNFKTTIYPAKRYIERYGNNAIFGHFHTYNIEKQERIVYDRSRKRIKFETVEVFSLPPLAEPPIYSKIGANLIQGFCVINECNIKVYYIKKGKIIE